MLQELDVNYVLDAAGRKREKEPNWNKRSHTDTLSENALNRTNVCTMNDPARLNAGSQNSVFAHPWFRVACSNGKMTLITNLRPAFHLSIRKWLPIIPVGRHDGRGYGSCGRCQRSRWPHYFSSICKCSSAHTLAIETAFPCLEK